MDDPEPRVAAYYDDLAPHWDEIVASPQRTERLWPTLASMLPDPEGRRIIDAGCGAGVYADALADAGADVVGVDVSEAMVREASDLSSDATFVRADLREGLTFLEDGSVDAILCQHVCSHLPDLSTPLAEFARVLDDQGTLVVSTHDPVHDYVVVRDGAYPSTGDQADLDPVVEGPDGGPTYGETERFDVRFEGADVADRATYYRRSFETLVGSILDVGFVLEDVAELAYDDSTCSDDGTSGSDPDEDLDYPPEWFCLRATLRD